MNALTEPLTVSVPYLYDDGETTQDATLTGLVYLTFPDYTVEIQSLVIDATGEEVDVPSALRRDAENELNDAAFMQQRSCA